MLGCVVSWAVGVAAWVVSGVVSPLDRPCDEDELSALLGSELCTVVGAVLCVVGVAWGLDAEPLDAVDGVLCVVGVACGLDAEPLDPSGAVPCVVGIEFCDDGDVVAVDCVLGPVPDEVEPPRSA